MRWTRWHVAGTVLRWFPDIRGSDRLTSALAGRRIPAALLNQRVSVRFGPDLAADVHLGDDGSFRSLFFVQYRPPALLPILEAALGPGDTFYDVGANIGVYTAWASRLVGRTGSVFAFEPVPTTRTWLENLSNQNALTNVTVVPSAVSSASGQVTIQIVPQASGLSKISKELPPSSSEHSSVAASAVTLDEFAHNHESPSLVKIDVEGHEADVIKGMEGQLATARPAVVFEAPDLSHATPTAAEITAHLVGFGYRVWSLTRRGLVPFDTLKFSHNLLALHDIHHERLRRDLSEVPFSRNQNC